MKLLKSKDFRIYKNEKDSNAYFDISFALIEKNIFLLIKCPVESIIYSTNYVFNFKNVNFNNLTFTNCNSQKFGTQWISYCILSKQIFYYISHYEIENIQFSVIKNCPNSLFYISPSDALIIKSECKKIYDYGTQNKILPSDANKSLTYSPIDSISINTNLKTKYGREKARQLANFKYANGSEQYRKEIDYYKHVLWFIIIIFVIIIIILKYL